jgi:hypothetical protein
MKQIIPYRETENYIIRNIATIFSNILKKINIKNKRTYSVCDLGCGKGDILNELANIARKYPEINFTFKVLDYDKKFVMESSNRLKDLKISNIIIEPIVCNIFDSEILPYSDFIYLFWRKSDTDNFNWEKILSYNSIILSYKHKINKLDNYLSYIKESDTKFKQYENLYVYDTFKNNDGV